MSSIVVMKRVAPAPRPPPPTVVSPPAMVSPPPTVASPPTMPRRGGGHAPASAAEVEQRLRSVLEVSPPLAATLADDEVEYMRTLVAWWVGTRP